MTIERVQDSDYYVRSAEGDTFHVESLEDGLRHLVSEEGYRLTIGDYDDIHVVIRRVGVPIQNEMIPSQLIFGAEIVVGGITE